MFLSLQCTRSCMTAIFFFFNDTATTEIYTLSLHDALPISAVRRGVGRQRTPAREGRHPQPPRGRRRERGHADARRRSEEHTSELQSQSNLVCRLLLEKKHDGSLDASAKLLLRLHGPHEALV